MDVDLLRSLSDVRVPDYNSKIYKEECTVSFDTAVSAEGLFVDLISFHAFGRDYVLWNYEKTGHSVYLNICRTRVTDSEEPPTKKPTRLAIGLEGGFNLNEDKYSEQYKIVIVPSFTDLPYPDPSLPDTLVRSVEAVLSSTGAEKQDQLASWAAAKKESKYALDLLQLDNGVKIPPSSDQWQCAKCEKRDNLWLNLTDGSLLCGRKNWDGSGGNNHALEQYEVTRYPLAVKIGTITSDLEAADVYSYAEDDTVTDPLLAQHLAHFGIDFSSLKKTEMTTAERELDQNLSFDWTRIQESGKELQIVDGPGLIGVHNLGNSCYMASVLQVLFSVSHFQNRYFLGMPLKEAFFEASSDPNTDFVFQMCKMAHALLSGKYSALPPSSQESSSLMGVTPQRLKAIVGQGHPEFSTSRQQDAFEFFQHMVDQTSSQHSRQDQHDPSLAFAFRVQERIQCSASGAVQYKKRADNVLSLPIPLQAACNADELAAYKKLKEEAESAGDTLSTPAPRPRVPLAACLDAFGSSEVIEEFYSTAVKGKTSAYKKAGLLTFPDYLVLHMRKYVLDDGWVPRKLDVLLDMPDELDINHLKVQEGPLPGEQLLPDDEKAAVVESGTSPDPQIVGQLMEMGFGERVSEKAAAETGNTGLEEAMNWVLSHLDDDTHTLTLSGREAGSQGDQGGHVDEQQLAMLSSFGFSETAARNGLIAMGGNIEAAAEWIITHPQEAELPPTSASQETPAPSPSSAVQDNAVPDGGSKYSLFAFVSHMGANTHSGHYVCHIKKGGRWVLFNDAKVALSHDVPKEMGYLYFYQRSAEE